MLRIDEIYIYFPELFFKKKLEKKFPVFNLNTSFYAHHLHTHIYIGFEKNKKHDITKINDFNKQSI